MRAMVARDLCALPPPPPQISLGSLLMPRAPAVGTTADFTLPPSVIKKHYTHRADPNSGPSANPVDFTLGACLAYQEPWVASLQLRTATRRLTLCVKVILTPP
jgi:hypothetical protein